MVGIMNYDLKEAKLIDLKHSIRDEYVPLVKKTIEDKYRVIDSFIEIF